MQSALSIILSLSLLALSHSAFAESWDSASDDGIDFEQATVCGAESKDCRKISCMDMCVKGGEDPLECPSYCILEASQFSPAERYDLHSSVLKTERAVAAK